MSRSSIILAASLLVGISACDNKGGDDSPNGGAWVNVCVGAASNDVHRLIVDFEDDVRAVPKYPSETALVFPLSFSMSSNNHLVPVTEVTLEIEGEDWVGNTVVEGSHTWTHDPLQDGTGSDYWIYLCLSEDGEACDPPGISDRCPESGVAPP